MKRGAIREYRDFLSDEERARILRAVALSEPAKVVAREINCTPRTIDKWKRKYRIFFHVPVRHRRAGNLNIGGHE